MYVKTFLAASPGLYHPNRPSTHPSAGRRHRPCSQRQDGKLPVSHRESAPPQETRSESRPDCRADPRRASSHETHREPRSSTPRPCGLLEATTAARELTLQTIHCTLRSGRFDSGEESLDLAAELRCATAGVALGLETRTAPSLLTALHSLWRASELIDRAERAGLLEIEEAMEMLVLGSRVEIPLVRFLRRCGFERSLQAP